MGVLEALSSLDRSTRVSVLSFDSVVSLHHLGGQPTAESSEPSTSSTAFSLTLPGSRPLDPTLLSTYITGAVRGPGGCKAVLHADMSGGLQHIEAALRSIRPLESDRSLEQRPRCAWEREGMSTQEPAAGSGLAHLSPRWLAWRGTDATLAP